MAMEKHAFQLNLLQTCSVSITAFAMKTPNALNIKTIRHNVNANLVSLEVATVQMDAFLLEEIHAIVFNVKTVEFASQMESPLLANVHRELIHLCVKNLSMFARKIFVSTAEIAHKTDYLELLVNVLKTLLV